MIFLRKEDNFGDHLNDNAAVTWKWALFLLISNKISQRVNIYSQKRPQKGLKKWFWVSQCVKLSILEQILGDFWSFFRYFLVIFCVFIYIYLMIELFWKIALKRASKKSLFWLILGLFLAIFNQLTYFW